VIVVGGDGDGLGEGMGHFIHALRGNANITYLLHNNKIYGLTTGQSSPTSEKGFISRSTPAGQIEIPVKPLKLALAAGGGFVARGYAGKPNDLKELIKKGIQHRGFSFIDILQPCVTFNKVNTYEFYNSRVYDLAANGYEPTDYNQAMLKADEWGDKIPLGLFYHDSREPYEDDLPQEQGQAIVARPVVKRNLTKLVKEFM
jgi:2-oxoglutarate ferredoxin oxidoreductase subunit beta